jgi:hypothetical protein
MSQPIPKAASIAGRGVLFDGTSEVGAKIPPVLAKQTHGLINNLSRGQSSLKGAQSLIHSGAGLIDFTLQRVRILLRIFA